MKRLSALFLLALARVASANDGFYQGAGASLNPIENPHARVVTERLDITPVEPSKCSALEIPREARSKNGEPKEGGVARVGGEVPCRHQGFNNLIASWHARAEYRVSIARDLKGVRLGFPVPEWGWDVPSDPEGLVGLRAPSVAGFRTWQDGRAVGGVALRQARPNAHASPTSTYTWTTNLSKGPHTLITEYDFGMDYSLLWVPGMYYPKEAELWFTARDDAGNDWRGTTPMSAGRVIYFLTPVASWKGAPPEEIVVRVQRPSTLSVEHLIPNRRGVDCVDEDALYFRWTNAAPETELEFTVPWDFDDHKASRLPPLRTQLGFDRWSDLLSSLAAGPRTPGRPAFRMTCGLRDRMVARLPLDAPLREAVRKGDLPCVDRCAPAAFAR